MAKLKSVQIDNADMIEYLNSYSDFSFELAVLKMLREHGVECEHGGHYEDPVTNKSREFDIRATKTIEHSRVRMAVECKNIRENFPILVSCIPRHEQESYHQIAFFRERTKTNSTLAAMGIFEPRVKTLNIGGEYSLYRPMNPVGKSTVQIGRALDGTISAHDSELYDKWGQCLGSLKDLIDDMYWDGDRNDSDDVHLSTIFPFVVVPNGRLWMVSYDEAGNRVCEPHLIDRCSCYIGKEYEMGGKLERIRILLSHVEIVTFDGMRSFVEQHLISAEGMSQIFPKDGLVSAYKHLANI